MRDRRSDDPWMVGPEVDRRCARRDVIAEPALFHHDPRPDARLGRVVLAETRRDGLRGERVGAFVRHEAGGNLERVAADAVEVLAEARVPAVFGRDPRPLDERRVVTDVLAMT